ncbi:MAG: sulfotransferase domain-containing protein, partial [Woeseiaceae bacterium]
NHGIPLFVKTHHANMLTNGVEMLPCALTRSTIFIVRDPRDVLPSFAKHMGCDIDQAIEWMTDKYKTISPSDRCMADFISSWDAHTLSFLNTNTHNVKVFRYEDMRADPVKEFSAILKHAGVTPEPLRVRQALKLVELDKLREQEKIDGFMESSIHAKNEFFGKGEVGGWKDKLTPKHQHRIEKDFGRVMKRLGYMSNKKAATWH